MTDFRMAPSTQGNWHYPVSWTSAGSFGLSNYWYTWHWIREQTGPDTVERVEWESSDG